MVIGCVGTTMGRDSCIECVVEACEAEDPLGVIACDVTDADPPSDTRLCVALLVSMELMKLGEGAPANLPSAPFIVDIG